MPPRPLSRDFRNKKDKYSSDSQSHQTSNYIKIQQYNWSKYYNDRLQKLNKYLSYAPKISYQPSLTKYHCHKAIRRQLRKMGDKNIDFMFCEQENQDNYEIQKQGQNEYVIKRVIKLRFKCKNQDCQQFKVKEDKRKWTTYYGLVAFKFYIKEMTLQQRQDEPTLKYPFILRYQFRIYGQKCLECKQMGSGSIIETILKDVTEIYYLVLSNIFLTKNILRQFQLDRKQKYGKSPYFHGDVKLVNGRTIGHLEKYCEACILKECVYFYKVRRQNQQNPYQ